MRYSFTLLLLLFCITIKAQSKAAYLKKHRQDLTDTTFVFPQTDFNIIGFGAYHGSAKTYDAELLLIKSLKQQNALDYYIPETNFSQAFFFQEYLETGNDDLLKELVLAFQTIVTQEGTIETYQHWKNIREVNRMYPNEPIKVLGFDIINEYRFPIKHILYLTRDISKWQQKEQLQELLDQNKTDLSIRNDSLKEQLKNFIKDYNENKFLYMDQIKDTLSFNHILKNIGYTLETTAEREKIIFDNYISLIKPYQLDRKKQFAKYGFFHIQKTREAAYPSFFTRLIENNIYTAQKVITITGYLTKSEVFWDKIYDEDKNYMSFTVEKGYGIGDYWKERFKGIRKLKQNRLSDLTLFRLNAENSPYKKGTDLVEVKLSLKKSNSKQLKGKNTIQFMDYALLIRNSKHQIPIEELK